MNANRIKQIVDAINNMTESELINLNNTYCQCCNIDSEVYGNDEDFFATFFPNAGDGLKVAQAVHFGNYNYSHDWVRFNGYGNLESIATFGLDDLCESVQVIAEYVSENESEFSDLFDFTEIAEAE